MEATLTRTKTDRAKIRPGSAGLWIVMIAALYLARDVLGINFPQSLFTAICLVAFLITDAEEGLCVFAFTSVLTLPGNEIRLVYLAVFLIKQRHILRRMKRYNSLILLVLIDELIVSYLYHTGSLFQFVYQFVVYALYLVIPVVWSQHRFAKDGIVRAVKSFVVGIFFSGAVSIYLAVKANGWLIVLSGKFSLGMVDPDQAGAVAMVTSNNRNGLAVHSAVAIALILVLLATKRARKTVSIVGIILLLMVILLTRSRTGVLMLALTLVYWVLLLFFRRGRFKSGVLIIAGMALLIYGLYRIFPDAWNGVYGRFTEAEDITNGRLYWNSLYLDKWWHGGVNLLVGFGKNTYHELLGIYGVPHNMVVDVLVCSGALGFVALLVWLGHFLTDQLRRVSKEYRAYALLAPFVFFVSTMGGQYFTVALTHIFQTFLILSILMMSDERTTDEEKEKVYG